MRFLCFGNTFNSSSQGFGKTAKLTTFLKPYSSVSGNTYINSLLVGHKDPNFFFIIIICIVRSEDLNVQLVRPTHTFTSTLLFVCAC